MTAEWPETIPEAMRDHITCGDAFDLLPQIGDEAIDFIFTDPIYKDIEHYERLAIQAARILKQGRSCMVWCSNVGQYAVWQAMSPYLTFIMPFYYTVIAKSAHMRGFNTFIWTTPCLWFGKGHARAIRGVPDTLTVEMPLEELMVVNNALVSKNPPASDGFHKWNKNPEAYEPWLLAMTNENDIVLDTCAGSGTIEYVCKRNGRRWIGMERDSEHARKANARIDALMPSEIFTMTTPDFFLTFPDIVPDSGFGRRRRKKARSWSEASKKQ